MRKQRPFLIPFLIIGIILVADQALKIWVKTHFYIGEEGEAFQAAVRQLTVDVFDWYRSIEGEEGVYVLHSDWCCLSGSG